MATTTLTEKQIIDGLYGTLDAEDEVVYITYPKGHVKYNWMEEAKLQDFIGDLRACFMVGAVKVIECKLIEPTLCGDNFEPYYKIKLLYHEGEELENVILIFIDKEYIKTETV
jgi:hypothetical protein